MTRFALLLLSTLLLCSSLSAKLLNGKVIKVYDGDTVLLQQVDDSIIKIRLSGIDSPERHQPYWRKARQYLSSQIYGKNIVAEYNKKDKYGRIIAKIIVNNNDINLSMIQAGYAWHYKKYQYEQSVVDRELYSEADAIAKKDKLGLFQHNRPIPPWVYRWNKIN